MDVIIKDYNGNTLKRIDNLLRGDAFDASYRITEAGNLIITVAAEDVQDEDAELDLAERMEEYTNPADEMRAMPDWRL